MNTFALQQIYEQVQDWFNARGGGVEQTVGFDAADRFQSNEYARLAWVPGDPSKVMSATSRDVDAVEFPDEHPGCFGVIVERFHVYVSAFDPADSADFWRQYSAVKQLHNLLRKCIDDLELPIEVQRVDWISASKIYQHGLALRVIFAFEEVLTVDEDDSQTVYPWTAQTRFNDADEVYIETTDSPPQT